MTRDGLLALFPPDTEQGRHFREVLAEIDREHERERTRLLALFDEAPVFLALVEGPDFRVTRVNRRIREAAVPPKMGTPSREIYPGDNPVVAALERVYATGDPETIQGQPPYYRDGALADRYFTRSLQPLRDEQGKVYAIVTAGYEVTDQVRAVFTHQQTEQRNQIELDRLSSVLEEAPALFTVLEGPELRVVMMNRRTRELFPGQNLIGVPFRDLAPPSNATLVAATRVYRTGVPETHEITAEMAGLAGRSFSTTVVPIRDGGGTIIRILTMSLEVTEQRRTRQQLEAQARDLEVARREAVEASLAKDEFLAMLGHELRNPLAPIVTTLSLMRLDGAGSPEVELLERQVRHLVRLVDDLLDVSRLPRGMVELHFASVQLPHVVHRALEMTSPLLDRRQQRIVADLAPATVHGDVDRLAQAVANLITNAAKYSEIGAQVRIRTESSGGVSRVTIADDGIGIAPDMLGQVFDAFVQQRQTLARSEGGLGLGLAIVKGLVEAHGGTVTAHSAGLGKGSTFVIELPAHENASAVAAPPSPQPRPARGPAKRILVVDDNRDAALSLRRALERLGQVVMVAHDGPTALEQALAFQPQIGLLDIGLPGMDGYQLARVLRESLDLRLFAVTGYGEAHDHQRSREAGFEEHLVKPVDLDRLAALLERPHRASRE
jgi:signal transduction histidine kinase